MKPYLKTIYNEVTQVIDKETGEELSVSHKNQKIVVETEKEFFFVYAAIVNALMNETVDAKVLSFLMFKCINSDGEFSNNLQLRDKVTKALNISKNTFLRALKTLNETNICLKTHIRGAYQINPEYIWKGDSRTRKKRLQLILENKGE